MDVSVARRLAASVLKVGESRVWIDPERLEEVSAAITREDVRRLIKDGVIKALPPSTPSRGRLRIRKSKKRGKGPGSKKGPRIDEKAVWIARVRSQRRYLKALKAKGLIDRKSFWRVYKLVKGGTFRSLSHLKLYLSEHKLVKVKESA
ncbi:MAG: 50S ribosomal protein L19e [Infirmifilum sp.]|jgi:large subunit ribosomal protein L19e|uniref:Large ribosomal subunit protein eL19 n=1 Tax=Infirmifilum uzonense TaxID=1550241 RepID=A0A0F7FG48_9CREN|nr:50S ribosomal protein L19e [Infirmifilum uzonense]AKG38048.1 50S ribosomal protein L19 [Infirmifilum uzonense]